MRVGSVGVAVGTFGDHSWVDLARSRALASVERQSRQPDQVVHVHAATLHEARNAAAAQLATEWVIFLDADDELDQRYVEAMLAGRGDLRQPATMGVHPDGREETPVVIPPKPLMEGNYIVIGAMVRLEQFHRVGGFLDWPAWEDWCLWVRCWMDGAEIAAVPEAVYRVYVAPRGRNVLPRPEALTLYNRMRQYFGGRMMDAEAAS